MNLEERMALDASQIEKALENYFCDHDEKVPYIDDAMSYTTLAGGKRIRAFLCLAFARMSGATEEQAIPFACALEMVHAYSLIHDDLPCMDNDDIRRGKPSNHKVFGEAYALLAGDGLLTYAFNIIANNDKVSCEARVKAASVLSCCAGHKGMIGGQVLDLEGEKKPLSFEELTYLEKLKTGELIKAACLLGCSVNENGKKYEKLAEEYAYDIGIVFQIVDDILDVKGDEKLLGKPIGSDAENNKTTFLSFMTLEEAEKYCRNLTEKAVAGLDDGEYASELRQLAFYLLGRKK